MKALATDTPVRPITVVGVVQIGDRPTRLRVHRELLVIDARAWFARQLSKHRGMVAEGVDARDTEFATEMAELCEQLELLLREGRHVGVPGMWPQIENRSKLEQWEVCNAVDARRYASRLIEFGQSPSAEEQLEFLLRVSPSPLLQVTRELEWVTRWSGDFFGSAVVEEIAL